MRTLLVVAALACVVELGSSGQAPTASIVPAGAAISGRVVDDRTEQPLDGAIVTILDIDRRTGTGARSPSGSGLNGPDRLHDEKTITVSDGRYSFAGIAAARYLVVASRAGYVQQTYGASSNILPEGLAVAAGQHVENIDFRLARGATVGGQVLDQHGRPFADAHVTVLPIREGGTGPFASSVTADARGDYRIEGLPVGNYHFLANVVPNRRANMTAVFARVSNVYYPGVTSSREAAVVAVSPGDVIGGVDITVTVPETYTVSGSILRGVSLTGSYPVEAFVTRSPGSSIRTFVVGENDSFTISFLEPGRYVLWVRARTDTDTEVSWQVLDLQADLSDLQLSMRPAGTISGRVVTVDGEPLPNDGLRVVAALSDGKNDVDPTSRDQAEVQEDGSFTLDGLFGERRMRVIGLPAGWSLAGVQIGRQSVSSLTIDAGDRIENLLLVIARR